MTFDKWSHSNSTAREVLRPNLGIRSWDEIDRNQKKNIWLCFINKGWFGVDKGIHQTIYQFNEDNKARSFCNNLQQHGGPHLRDEGGWQSIETCCPDAAQRDFDHIFHEETQDVFYELISYYIGVLREERIIDFIDLFNDISNQFGLNVLLNKEGFILRQDEKITKEIFEPVLNCLGHKKWEPVSRDFRNATSAYLKNTEEGYSSSITLACAALQGFMQIIVNGEIGKGDLGILIKEAQRKELIPNNSFTVKIFKDIESILMQERQTKGDPHPKKEYANEKTARLVLNLVMIFMQHCLQ
ncbi:MAG: hypothetical protein WC702_03955 [Patescibacteria group bacterium]|jgi:hypothetical protein